MAKATTKAASRSSTPAKKSTTTKASGAKKSTAASKTAARNGLDKFLEGQLKLLEEERATYLHQAETLQAEADSLTEDREPGDVQFDEESGEGDTLAVERERDLALSAQARAAIEEIDRAIEKIYDGSYGQCESCGTAIPKERLKALPYAALCVKCKSGGLGLSR
jgi:DnaK suppressor protein